MQIKLSETKFFSSVLGVFFPHVAPEDCVT